jgi:2-polyprenyl-6-methoxyphenol hydroxylase-like FAD-dependent oxidoreductase
MAPATLRVLISGGGIAGNALAFWLARQGHDITVVEHFPSLRASGLQIDLRGAGIEVLRRMGLEDAFRAQAAPEQGMQFVDGSGRRRGYFPANKSGSGRQSFTSEFEMMRGSMCRILYDAANACKTPPRYIFGTSVASFEQKGNSVDVRFEDGKTDTFDLLVGADGQWSRTRRMMLGPDTPDAVQLIPSLYIAYFTMRQPMKKGDEYLATAYMAPGRRGVMTRRHSPEEIQVLLTCNPRPDPLGKVSRGDVEKEKEAFESIYKGAKWITEDLLKAMRAADDFYCERLGLVKLKSWSSGHVTLIGDAAHCPTAMSGMGTTCAMIGAYILAGEIGRYCAQEENQVEEGTDGLAAALKRYEQKFRPFAEGMQEGIFEKAEKQWTMTGSAFGIGVLNFMMGVASFFKVNIAEMFGIRETVEGWELPDYEGMTRDK